MSKNEIFYLRIFLKSVMKTQVLQKFLRNPNVIFTTDRWKNGALPFMDVLVTRWVEDINRYAVQGKPTHTKLLCTPSQSTTLHRKSSIGTQLRKAPMLCDAECLKNELQHPKEAVEQDGYCRSDIRRALNPKQKPKLDISKLTDTAMIS